MVDLGHDGHGFRGGIHVTKTGDAETGAGTLGLWRHGQADGARCEKCGKNAGVAGTLPGGNRDGIVRMSDKKAAAGGGKKTARDHGGEAGLHTCDDPANCSHSPEEII